MFEMIFSICTDNEFHLIVALLMFVFALASMSVLSEGMNDSLSWLTVSQRSTYACQTYPGNMIASDIIYLRLYKGYSLSLLNTITKHDTQPDWNQGQWKRPVASGKLWELIVYVCDKHTHTKFS